MYTRHNKYKPFGILYSTRISLITGRIYQFSVRIVFLWNFLRYSEKNWLSTAKKQPANPLRNMIRSWKGVYLLWRVYLDGQALIIEWWLEAN